MFLLAAVVLSTGCVENKKVKIEEGPEIFTTLPAELDTYSSGSYVSWVLLCICHFVRVSGVGVGGVAQ